MRCRASARVVVVHIGERTRARSSFFNLNSSHARFGAPSLVQQSQAACFAAASPPCTTGCRAPQSPRPVYILLVKQLPSRFPVVQPPLCSRRHGAQPGEVKRAWASSRSPAARHQPYATPLPELTLPPARCRTCSTASCRPSWTRRAAGGARSGRTWRRSVATRREGARVGPRAAVGWCTAGGRDET